MKARTITALLALAALTVAGCGSGGGDTADPATETVTATDTITITEPGATVTEGVAVPMKGAPQVCLDALDAGDQIIRDGGHGIGLVVKYIPLIKRAFLAGLNQDVAAGRAIIRDESAITAQVQAATAKIDSDGAAYRAAASNCRAHG
jgi:hypothetical protein